MVLHPLYEEYDHIENKLLKFFESVKGEHQVWQFMEQYIGLVPNPNDLGEQNSKMHYREKIKGFTLNAPSMKLRSSTSPKKDAKLSGMIGPLAERERLRQMYKELRNKNLPKFARDELAKEK